VNVEDIRRLQAVNGDRLRGTLNVAGIGLITPVEDPVRANIRGLEGSLEATMPQKYVRGGGQVLENKRGWRCMLGRW
jgi:hypothetical protein